MLEAFTIDTFSPLVGSAFALNGPAQVELELASASDLGDGATGTGRRPFSLVFRGPRTPVLPQRIYQLEHATLGAFELFIVPIGPDDQGAMRYEAVFT